MRILSRRARQPFFTGSHQGGGQELYLKGASALLAIRDVFVRGDADLESLKEQYVKGNPTLNALVQVYVKGDVAFGVFEKYLKGDVAFVAAAAVFVKGDVSFAENRIYLKGDAALVVNPPLPDLGAAPPATKVGLLSRNWLSVTSVKKDVT